MRLLLLLLAVQWSVIWAGAPVIVLLEALDPNTVMSLPPVGLPIVERIDVTAPVPAPAVVGVRDIVVPLGLTCDSITIDVPLGRQWPGFTGMRRDPARSRFYRFVPPYNLIAGSWDFAKLVRARGCVLFLSTHTHMASTSTLPGHWSRQSMARGIRRAPRASIDSRSKSIARGWVACDMGWACILNSCVCPPSLPPSSHIGLAGHGRSKHV